MSEKYEVTVKEADEKATYTFGQALKRGAFVAFVAGVTALSAPAFAEDGGSLDYTSFTAEIESAKTAVIGILGAMLVIYGIVQGYRVFKSSRG